MFSSFRTSTTMELIAFCHCPSVADNDSMAACSKAGLPSLRITFAPIFKHLFQSDCQQEKLIADTTHKCRIQINLVIVLFGQCKSDSRRAPGYYGNLPILGHKP